MKLKYVVTCGFCTDGDFSIFHPVANLEKSMESEYDFYGAFEVIDQLTKIVSAINDSRFILLPWAIEQYGLAIHALREAYDNPIIFHAQCDGNYSSTFLHIQTIQEQGD